jgi:hypothetical protein
VSESEAIKTDLVPRKRGRPPVIAVNPEIRQQLIDIIRRGNYVQTAMTALGLSDDFYYHCVEMASRGQKEYCQLVKELKKAESEAEIDVMAKMMLGKEHFLPAATFLERRFRDRWGRSDKHQVTADINIRVEQVDYVRLAKEIGPKKSK